MQTTLNVPTDLNEPVARWAMDSDLLRSRQPAINGLATIAYDLTYCGGKVHKIVKDCPTYNDLFSIANELILRSGDKHHVYIEDFMYDKDKDCWLLITGS